MYIYHLPYQERQELCYILDQNNKWEELAGAHMQYDLPTLDSIKKVIFKGGSPTCELLTTWGHQNHTVLELFVLLSRMKMYRAMSAIKHLVEEKYHFLLRGEEENLNQMIRDLKVNKCEKKCKNVDDSKIKPENFFGNNEKLLNVPKLVVQPVVTKDDNATIGENNHNNNNNNNNKRLLPRSPIALVRSRTLTASDISIVAESAGAIPSIPYEELQKSTNNWDENAVLGKGGFGKVYKGIWKCTQVAIKRLETKNDKPNNESEQIKQSITELQCLNAYRHDNVLPVYGYSIGGPHPCLVYQYMAGGSLDQRLRVRDLEKVLKWPTRLNIAIGAARGLQFLHTNMINEKPLVHGDIKSANILLDSNDQPRIGDFGLAREGPQSHYTHIQVSRVHGTRPYLPDEFLRFKKFSIKVDTYSFGVVLFEIATSLPPYWTVGKSPEKQEGKFLKDHVVNYEGDVLNLKDKRVEGYDSYFKSILEIGKMCVSKLVRDRPEMVKVLSLLEETNTNETGK